MIRCIIIIILSESVFCNYIIMHFMSMQLLLNSLFEDGLSVM